MLPLYVLVLIVLAIGIVLIVYFRVNIEKKELQLKHDQLVSENTTIKSEIEHLRKMNMELSTQLSGIKEKANLHDQKNQELEKRLEEMYQKNAALQAEKSQYLQKIEYLETALTNQKQELQNIHEQLKKEFELISSKLLEQNTQKLTEQNHQVLGTTLLPLKDYMQQIKEIESKIQRYYDEENKERASLKTFIEELSKKSEEIGKKAEGLAQALTSQVKYQGNWGEMILERLLEISGLKENIDYIVQRRENDKQPDVIIKLPNNKNIIIDSKVTLNAVVKYQSAETDEEREKYGREIIQSIKIHYKSLSEKNYEQIFPNSLDFVLMFIPLEFVVNIIQKYDIGIYEDAIRSKVFIVTPTSLLSVLKTIHFIWQQEKQRKNLEDIISSIHQIYNKLRVFTEHLNKVKVSIQATQEAFEKAEKNLVSGQGNVMSIIEKKIIPYLNPKERIVHFLPTNNHEENNEK